MPRITFAPSFPSATSRTTDLSDDGSDWEQQQVAGRVEENREAAGDSHSSGEASSSLGDAWVVVTEADTVPETGPSRRSHAVRGPIQSPTDDDNDRDTFQFDDEDALIPAEDWGENNWVFRFDYEVPIFDGRRVHERYRFEVEHPRAASALRTGHGLGNAWRSGNIRRAAPTHARRLATAAYNEVSGTLRTQVSEATSFLQETAVPAAVEALDGARAAIPAMVDGAREAIPAMVDEARAAIPAMVNGARAVLPDSVGQTLETMPAAITEQGRRARQRIGEVLEDMTGQWLELGAQYFAAYRIPDASRPRGRR
jgi:hypothetical protein